VTRRSGIAIVAAIAVPMLFAIGTSLPAYAATHAAGSAVQSASLSPSPPTTNSIPDPGDEDCNENNVGALYEDEDGYWWECVETSYGYAWRMIFSCGPGAVVSSALARLTPSAAAC
jgi:hypothetical protein